MLFIYLYMFLVRKIVVFQGWFVYNSKGSAYVQMKQHGIQDNMYMLFLLFSMAYTVSHLGKFHYMFEDQT